MAESAEPISSNAGISDHTTAISKALGSLIQSTSAVFACGGAIPIRQDDDYEGQDDYFGGQDDYYEGQDDYYYEGHDDYDEGLKSASSQRDDPTVPPVTLRWDSPSGISKMSFPVERLEETGSASLLKLARDCQPATFGYKGQDVLDETYRKATKMDRKEFSIDFCPYECGIIDVIAQLLLPVVHESKQTMSVRAELYKLNIYTAPSGFFKTHVDTPRSEEQFGSLVVSLPCFHKGGQLIVRHNDKTSIFDWQTPEDGFVKPEIQWGAFYSDCEHEVLQVTDGHRVTLTYNLYWTRGQGSLAGHCPILDTKSLPLFHHLQAAIEEPNFMPNGGYLGIHCQHAYAHTMKHSAKYLPAILKGEDMAVLSVLQELGLQVEIRAVVLDGNPYFKEYEKEFLDKIKTEGQVAPDGSSLSFIGPIGCLKLTYRHDFSDEIVSDWNGQLMNIHWVNTSTHRFLEMVHPTYGNQVGIDCVYSSAALLVQVLPAKERDTVHMTEESKFSETAPVAPDVE